MRKPAGVIVEDGLHPNPAPPHSEQPEEPDEKRRRQNSTSKDHKQEQAAATDYGYTPTFTDDASQDTIRRGEGKGSPREEGYGEKAKVGGNYEDIDFVSS